MDDEEFYKALGDLDQGVADRWKRATGGKLKTTISDDAIVAIFGPVIATHKITTKQAKAMQMFWAYTKMSKAAAADLYNAIATGYDVDWFFEGSRKALISDDDLRNFHAALGMNLIGKIDFVSPRTRLAYFPGLYNAMRVLVAKGDIKVFSVDAATLLGRAGVYRSDINRLVLYQGLDPAIALPTVVHEVTHAIQDWRDLVSVHKYIEADAFIAGTVASMCTGKQYFLEYPALEKAGRLVLAGKGGAGNVEFASAYGDVVTAIESDPQYAAAKDLPWKPMPSEKGTDEAKILDQLLKDIKQAEDFAEWGKDALNETFVLPIREGLKRTLP
jgi:hypothetical protein